MAAGRRGAMTTDDPYFGYTSGDNQQLRETWQLQHHLGEDLTHYPDADTSHLPQYDPTINWNDPQYSDHQGVKDAYVRRASDDTIEKIRQRIKSQSADQIDALNDQWFKVSMVIENLRDSIFNEAQALSANWKGDAAQAFLQRGPGAAIKSLDDWYDAALANAVGMLYLASTIRDHQSKMDTLYADYKADMVKFSHDWANDHQYTYLDEETGEFLDPLQAGSDDYLTDLRGHAEEWNAKARTLQYEMGQSYWQVVQEHLSGGSSTVFEGPTDAVVPDPTYLLLTPSLPGIPGGGPNAPQPPSMPALPQLPGSPGTPGLPLAPDVPTNLPDIQPLSQPNLAPQGAPDLKVSIDPAVVAGLAANPALLANIPNPGLAGSAPDVGGASGPGNLGGLGKGLGAPPGAKLSKGTLGRPQLGAGEEGPGRSPMAPNTVRNKAGKPTLETPQEPLEEEQFGRPSGLGSAPPVLRGRSRPGARLGGFTDEGTNRTGAPQRPGAAPPVLNRKRQKDTGAYQRGQLGPGGPGGDESTRAGLSNTSAPVLRGTRQGPGELSETPPGRALRGGGRRPAGVSEPEMTSRRKSLDAKLREERERVDREFEKIRPLLNDEQVWTVDTPGGAVLDNTPEPRGFQVEPKPTLGGAATG